MPPHVANIIQRRHPSLVGSKTFALDIDGTITENGGGRIHLGAMLALRHLKYQGHNVIFVTGRSSVEGYMLSIFGGMTNMAVGENGGCITYGSYEHRLLGDIEECRRAFNIIRSELDDVREKPVFPRMTEVVLERTFDLESAKSIVSERGLDVVLSDSQYAYHVNSKGVDKGTGFQKAMEMLSVDTSDVIAMGDSSTDIPLFKKAGISVALGNAFDDVKAEATLITNASSGDGVVEALNLLAPAFFEV